MPEQLDPVVADNLASGAMRYLPLSCHGTTSAGTRRTSGARKAVIELFR